MLIWVSGPTGAGKTSFASFLGEKGYRVIKEEIPQQLFFAFAKYPKRYCFDLQTEIIKSRLSQWSRAQSARNIAFDRAVVEDYQVFCRMHFEQGLLTATEFENLGKLIEAEQQALPDPDIVIYLHASEDCLRERLVANNQPLIIQQNFRRQLELYEQWFDAQMADKFRLDNSSVRPATIHTFLDSLI